MPELSYHDLRYSVDPHVYDPSDDTLLLLDSIRIEKGTRFLEVGCGAGLLSIHAAREGAVSVATDRNPHALRLTRQNAHRNGVDVHTLRADLLRGVRIDRFDAVAFNPPYLPTSALERLPGPINQAFDGGPSGREVVSAFLAQLRDSPPRQAWLVASTLQDLQALEQGFQEHGLAHAVCARKPLSHEILLVYHLIAKKA